MEVSTIGGDLTWTNNQVVQTSPNQSWTEPSPTKCGITRLKARMEFQVGSSDHKAMLIIISQAEKGTKPFR